MSELRKFYGKFRGSVVNNVDPMRMGTRAGDRPGRDRGGAVELGHALRAGGRAADGLLHRAADRRGGVGGVRAGRPGLSRSGPAVSGAARPRCRPWRRRSCPGCRALCFQTTAQNGLLISDTPGPTGGLMIQLATGASILINQTGITIQNGKGAMITMNGPVVNINTGALTIT